jgi:mannose-1-phosphate guanylyltransferase
MLSVRHGESVAGSTRARVGQYLPKHLSALLGGSHLFPKAVTTSSERASSDQMHVVIPRVWSTISRRRAPVWPGTIEGNPPVVSETIGILLPLVIVLADAPSSSMVIAPSDQGVPEPEAFQFAIVRALQAPSTSAIALLGVTPDRAQPRHGWVLPGYVPGGGACRGNGSKERPEPREATHSHITGGLWNTLVMAARGGRLWRSLATTLPAVARSCTTLWRLPTLLRDAPRLPPTVNIVHSVFADHADMVVVPVHDSAWSDWDEPVAVSDTSASTRM